MARLILVTGGGRSGKSRYAQELAEAQRGKKTYLATCPPLDDEMRERIRRHQAARETRGWETCEETINLVEALGRVADSNVVLLDCLTLWVNNLMFAERDGDNALNEDALALYAEDLATPCKAHPGDAVILVTNEVGMGIIPENALTRRYRDLAGRCNQTIAAAADDVVLMVSGVPLQIKTCGKLNLAPGD